MFCIPPDIFVRDFVQILLGQLLIVTSIILKEKYWIVYWIGIELELNWMRLDRKENWVLETLLRCFGVFFLQFVLFLTEDDNSTLDMKSISVTGLKNYCSNYCYGEINERQQL